MFPVQTGAGSNRFLLLVCPDSCPRNLCKETRTYAPRHQQQHHIDKSNNAGKVQHTGQTLQEGLLPPARWWEQKYHEMFPAELSLKCSAPSCLHHLNSRCAQARWRSCSKGLLTPEGAALPPPQHQDLLAGPKQLANPADCYSLLLLSYLSVRLVS